MYSKIQAMKEQGFSIRRISRIIRVKPEYDKEILGDASGRIRGGIYGNKPDDGANVL
jgi:hypothetical protein